MEQWEKQYKNDVKACDIKEKFVKWRFEDDDCLNARMIKMDFGKIMSKVVWHSKGDYFATLALQLINTSLSLPSSASVTF